MNKKYKTISSLFRWLLVLALASSPTLSAQEDDEDKEIYELSPFSIDESGTTGYMATETL